MISGMALKLEVAHDADFEDIVSLCFLAYSDPVEPYFDLVCPGHNPATYPGREQALEDTTRRWFARWKNTPAERWIKVLDTSSGKIVR